MRGANRKKAAALRPDEVQIHILRRGPGPCATPDEGFLHLLPREERERYLEFEFKPGRKEFLWTRLFVRRILASFLGRPMEGLDFGYEGNGKPFLKDSDLQFNFSHTEGLAACSVSYRRVGIDVEKMTAGKTDKRDWELLSRRFFSNDENERVFSRPLEDQMRVFYELFTMKEAAAKADGGGVGRFFGRPSPADKSTTDRWEYLREFLEPGGYCLAHAAEKKGRPVRYRFLEWTEASLRKILTPRSPALTEGAYGHLHG